MGSVASRTGNESGSSGRTRSRSTGSASSRPPKVGPDKVQAYGMALRLRNDPAVIARYKKEHARVWPEVLARLREIGVTEMKIFLLGERLFMYCETVDGFDPARDFTRTVDDPTYRRWGELLRGMQRTGDDARPRGRWAVMELDLALHPPQPAPPAGPTR